MKIGEDFGLNVKISIQNTKFPAISKKLLINLSLWNH